MIVHGPLVNIRTATLNEVVNHLVHIEAIVAAIFSLDGLKERAIHS